MGTKVCPKIVGIETRVTEAFIKTSFKISDIEIISLSENLQYLYAKEKEGGVTLYFKGMYPGRGRAVINIGSMLFTVPTVVFKEREFFLCMTVSSNSHTGFDPENFLRGCDNKQYENVVGHAFKRACRTLEPIYHKYNIPVTWLIDSIVADEGHTSINEWHIRYGDDYGVMPSSYFHHNPVNYNLTNTEEETYEFLNENYHKTIEKFDYYTEIVGIDQWVGGVGSNFVKSAGKLGMKGIWGLAFDHATCDSSMYHRGCPWDVYKIDKNNVKIPSREPSNLWAFQWTTRDIINSVHAPTGPSGAVLFSTDPDDIRNCGIMQHQRDYYTKMLREYKKNMKYNDHFVFLVHQEDHDTHFEEDNQYLECFLSEVSEEVTPATLQEVALWLNIKYADKEHPQQVLYLNDILDCKDKVQWNGPVKKPEDWELGDGKYPAHAAVYNRDFQVIFQKPRRKPYRVLEYSKNYICKETDSYPVEELEELRVGNEEFYMEKQQWWYKAEIYSLQEYSRYPWIIWDIPKDISEHRSNMSEIHTEDFILIFLRLKYGKNEIMFKL